MPAFFKATNYQCPVDSSRLPFNVEFDTQLSFYEYAGQNESVMRYAGQYMKCWHEGLKTWLDVYPLEEECYNQSPQEVLFVDVGGGFGQQCRALRQRLSHLTGRIVLQDLATTLASAGDIPDVQPMVHDFFAHQPVQSK